MELNFYKADSVGWERGTQLETGVNVHDSILC